MPSERDVIPSPLTIVEYLFDSSLTYFQFPYSPPQHTAVPIYAYGQI